MIRRRLADDCYLLISQTEHARLAAELATHWKSSSLDCYPCREELQFAILHHDDGWRSWEAAPDLEPVLGLPRNFTEMDTDTAMATAAAGIELCHAHSDACAFWVSRHFELLAEQRMGSPDLSQADARRIVRFIDHQVSFRGDLQLEGSPVLWEEGTAWLQFFDRLSLLLCCRVPDVADHLKTPDHDDVEVRYLSASSEVLEVVMGRVLRCDLIVKIPCVAYSRGGTLSGFREPPQTLTVIVRA